jgi:hypothetical protein
MDNELDPVVGNWYQHLDKGQMFQVVAIDNNEALIELQHFDGDLEEVELNVWRNLDIAIAAAPEDWTGPVDDIERDDLDYTETAMSDSDWQNALQETRSDEKEAWERKSLPDQDSDIDATNGAEETCDPEEIEALQSDSTIS